MFMDVLFLGSSGYQVKRTVATNGAPRYAIRREQLQFLLVCGFTIPRMSQLLGISTNTTKRRMRLVIYTQLDRTHNLT